MLAFAGAAAGAGFGSAFATGAGAGFGSAFATGSGFAAGSGFATGSAFATGFGSAFATGAGADLATAALGAGVCVGAASGTGAANVAGGAGAAWGSGAGATVTVSAGGRVPTTKPTAVSVGAAGGGAAVVTTVGAAVAALADPIAFCRRAKVIASTPANTASPPVTRSASVLERLAPDGAGFAIVTARSDARRARTGPDVDGAGGGTYGSYACAGTWLERLADVVDVTSGTVFG